MSQTHIPERGEIAEEFKWNLELIFPSVEAWESEFAKVRAGIPELAAYKGRLCESETTLYGFIKLEESLTLTLEKLYVYANMKSHEDLRISKYQELAERASMLNTEFSEAVAFYEPELLAAPEEKLHQLTNTKSMKQYAFHFEQILHEKPHTLSASEEEIIARAGDMARVPDTAFTMLTDADMKFPIIRDENDNDVELTEERYYKLSCSKNRDVRVAAFKGLFGTYAKYRNAFGALYNGSVRGDIFYARTRKYSSCLEASLYGDNVPERVYNNVVDTANLHVGLMHRYVSLRKLALKLKDFHYYDLNVPLTGEPSVDIPYDDAINMVMEALAPLGAEYCSILKNGFADKWIDVYENQGKRKGAYSWGSYGTKPYVLLNYNGTLRDVFTIAHEMGHSLHSYLSHGAQPQVYGDYTILLAEIASTTNEMLMLRHMMSTMPQSRAWLLNYALDMVRTTMFRQAMFAEYERVTHELAERGDALTPDRLCSVWKDLNARYYGQDMVIDEQLEMEWARIPHFYTAFYVYKYVTGFVSACSFSKRILNDGAYSRDMYINFLRSGSSAWSLDILKKAGVDLCTLDPFNDAAAEFSEWLDQMEWEITKTDSL